MNMYSIARKISIWGGNRGYYPQSDSEVIRYGLEVLLSQVITFIPVFIYACFSENGVSIILMIIIFSILRATSNGYHAKSFHSCFLITNIVLFIGAAIIPFFYPPVEIIVSLLFVITIKTLYWLMIESDRTLKQIINKMFLLIMCFISLVASFIFSNYAALLMIQYIILINYALSK